MVLHFLSLAILALSTLGISSTAVHAGDQDFSLSNHTGIDIHELYISPSDENDWQEDVLGEDVLADGESTDIEFSTSVNSRFWDVKIIDEDGESLSWQGLDLYAISEVSLYYENGKVWLESDAPVPNLEFELVNDTGVEIYALYISAAGEDSWEEDVLETDTLADGESVDLDLGEGSGAHLWDLRIEDEDEGYLEWSEMDLAGVTQVVLKLKGGKAKAEFVYRPDLDFELVNDTGIEIYALFLSPSQDDDWGEDVLETDTLADGDSIEVEFSSDTKAHLWDLRIEDEDGDYLVWEELNLTQMSAITLSIEGGEAVAKFTE
jgi:hypothetical protein